MIKRLSIALTAVAVLAGVAWSPAPARAQDKLAYGDAVDGEVTDPTQPMTYTFDGKQGDTAIIQVIPLESGDGSTLDIKAVLSDAAGTKLVDSTEDYAKIFVGAYADAFVEFLPADGTYTLTVSSNDEKSTGKYILQLFQPEALEFDQPVSVSATFKGYSRFIAIYTVPSDKPLALSFAENEGDAGLSVQILEYSNAFMRRSAGVDGTNASEVTLNMRPGNAEFYFITVASPGYVVADATLKYTVSAKLL
jgi:hypothetical protein